MSEVRDDEPYLLVEDVAERLGLPLSVLLHRVEAGDIPSRRVDTEDGVHYALRLGDLGIELDDEGMHSTVIRDDADEDTFVGTFERPADREATAPGEAEASVSPASNHEVGSEAHLPPPWMLQEPVAGEDDTTEAEQPPVEEATEQDTVLPFDAEASREATEETGDEPVLDEETVIAELAVPPPSREPVDLFDPRAHNPSGDLATMSLDARELVAGLLDRWERTLEQRIYTEQRQRFQAELASRQNTVKQLQMELQAARAEHAAAQAEKDRALAEKERELAERERDLAESHRRVEEAAHAVSRRRRWFFSRDD